MQLSHQRGSGRRRRFVLTVIVATVILGASGVSIAVALSSGGQGPLGEVLPAGSTATSPGLVVGGPEVSEAAAVAVAAKEAQAEGVGTSDAAGQAEVTATAVARTTRRIATQTIGQGEEPVDASPEVAAWYGGSVYVVSFVGQYVARDAPVPPGASAPTGRYLTLVVDAYSGKITGYELSNTNDLSAKVAAIGKA